MPKGNGEAPCRPAGMRHGTGMEPDTAWTRIPWRQAGIFPAYARKSQPQSRNPPNFITFAGQARPVAAGRGRERKVRATQSTAQANDLISVRV